MFNELDQCSWLQSITLLDSPGHPPAFACKGSKFNSAVSLGKVRNRSTPTNCQIIWIPFFPAW